MAHLQPNNVVCVVASSPWWNLSASVQPHVWIRLPLCGLLGLLTYHQPSQSVTYTAVCSPSLQISSCFDISECFQAGSIHRVLMLRKSRESILCSTQIKKPSQDITYTPWVCLVRSSILRFFYYIFWLYAQHLILLFPYLARVHRT